MEPYGTLLIVKKEENGFCQRLGRFLSQSGVVAAKDNLILRDCPEGGIEALESGGLLLPLLAIVDTLLPPTQVAAEEINRCMRAYCQLQDKLMGLPRVGEGVESRVITQSRDQLYSLERSAQDSFDREGGVTFLNQWWQGAKDKERRLPQPGAILILSPEEDHPTLGAKAIAAAKCLTPHVAYLESPLPTGLILRTLASLDETKYQ